MKAPKSLVAAAALAAAGCATRSPPPTPEAAAEQARRDERLRIMQQYWYDQTASPPAEPGAVDGASALLDYPAGSYGGINFAPRRAAGPGLEDPPR
jgi:hypothetical protein